MRCYSTPDGPAIFRLDAHLTRLLNSARVYRMPLQWSKRQLADACTATIARNGLDSCYIRPMVLWGYGAAGMNPAASSIETFICTWPWGSYLGDEALESGVDVCVSTWQRPYPNTFPATAKAAGHYNNAQLIKMEAIANGYAEAIALAPGGMVSEGSGQNLFLVHDDRLITPPIEGTSLAGITRASIIQIAVDMGIPVMERPVPRETLYSADELFFCGTASEVTPVRSVDKITIGSGTRGPITRRIQQQFLAIARGEAPDTHGWRTLVSEAAPLTAQ
jgi:branched-chain amino acid aminotransferase